MICNFMRIICRIKRYKVAKKVRKYEALGYDQDIIRLPRHTPLKTLEIHMNTGFWFVRDMALTPV